MYKIIFKGKRYNSKTFLTYDQARNYIRKLLRKKKFSLLVPPHVRSLKWRTPAISDFGFSVKKVA